MINIYMYCLLELNMLCDPYECHVFNPQVNSYTDGGAFGELALLHGDTRRATVRATAACVAW